MPPPPVLSVGEVHDTTIAYGAWPSLPSFCDVTLGDSLLGDVFVDWDVRVNPVVPGLYHATGRYSLREYGGADYSITVAIVVANVDSVPVTDTSSSVRQFFAGWFGSDHPIDGDSMAHFEKPIDFAHAFYAVCGTEEEYRRLQAVLDSVLGDHSRLHTLIGDSLPTHRTLIFGICLYRYTTYLMEGDVVFTSDTAESLLVHHPDSFETLYGVEYVRSKTLTIGVSNSYYLNTEGMTADAVAARLAAIRRNIARGDTVPFEYMNVVNPGSATISSALGLGGNYPPLVFLRNLDPFFPSPHETFARFVALVDSTKTSGFDETNYLKTHVQWERYRQ